MNEAVVLVAQGLRVELCKILELLPSGEFFLLRAGVGWKPGLIGTARVRAGMETQAGFALTSEVPVITEDLFAETRFRGSSLLHEHGVVSGISAIIYGKEKPLGVLSAHSIHKRHFTGDDVQFLRAVAHILGAAVARTQTEVARKHLEEQLRVSQKMEAIGQLAGGVAHDFNNILMAIGAYCELMMAKMKENNPFLPDVREVLKASDRGASLTRQLLAFSRRQVLAPKILDLNTVIENNEGMLRRLIGEDVELVTNLNSTLWRIEADPGQLEQILLNLSINARDAMPDGGMLFLHTANEMLEEGSLPKVAEMNPGPYIVLTVTDTGSGMDAETMAHIFEPFYTTKEQGKGTGLGLSTVYGIVKQSGAHITVLTTPGKGTTFRIYFPRIEDQSEAVEVPTVSRLPLPGGSETILFVDDNEPVRTAMSYLLQMKGYTVLSAETGDAALEIARNHSGTIDLLITDIVMPHMSGTELAQKLQSLRSPLKVLYISGYTVDDLFHKDTLDSDSAFLQKPVTLKAMLEKVREMLQPEV